MELEVNFYKPSTRTHIADMSSNARELRGTVAWGQTSSQKEKLIWERETVLLVLLLHLRGGRMTGSVGNTIIKVLQYGHCSRQGNHLFFRCSYAGCVHTPSKNVKNTEGRKVLLQFCFK